MISQEKFQSTRDSAFLGDCSISGGNVSKIVEVLHVVEIFLDRADSGDMRLIVPNRLGSQAASPDPTLVGGGGIRPPHARLFLMKIHISTLEGCKEFIFSIKDQNDHVRIIVTQHMMQGRPENKSL